MNSAIIVAAGEGKRFGGERPKQFAEILGKPVLIHTIERFEASSLIDEIVLVLSDDELHPFSETVEKFGISKISSIVAGGESRTASVLNGLSAVRAEETSIVAIHDGARPVVPQADIRSAIVASERFGAACLVAPVVDTIKRISDGFIERTIDRSPLRRAVTPQCFKYSVIIEAFENISEDTILTDDSSLAEAAGFKVAAVEGSPFNIKITYEQDLKAAEIYLRQMLEHGE